ncbi:MAG: transcription termination/antitermination protein NusG [Bryobacteraceae bacterium]
MQHGPAILPVAEPHWFAIQTRPRHEEGVCRALTRKGIHCYLPRVSEMHRWSDRRMQVQAPLFAGYTFVRIRNNPAPRCAVLRTSGVISFVGVRGVGVAIAEPEIQALRGIEEKGIPMSRHPYLNIGQRVRIRGGSLNGVEGILLSCRDGASLIISVELIQRSISIQISGYDVEPVRTAAPPLGPS